MKDKVLKTDQKVLYAIMCGYEQKSEALKREQTKRRRKLLQRIPIEVKFGEKKRLPVELHSSEAS